MRELVSTMALAGTLALPSTVVAPQRLNVFVFSAFGGIVASIMPATRASRVDVLQAIRSE